MSGAGYKKAQSFLERLATKLGHGGMLEVGFLAGATYSGTHPTRGGKTFKGPVAQVAFWNEFGAPKAGIPARPFMRTAVEQNSPEWAPRMAYIAKAVNYDTKKILTNMGIMIAEQIRTSLNEWTSPPNSPRTIAIKGFDKPLQDTAHMKRSIDYAVLMTP